MSFCGSCGAELKAGQVFCTSCGASRQKEGGFAAAADVSGAAAASAMSEPAASEPLAANAAATLAYLAGFITGIIFLSIEPYKSNSFVRFHAYQSIFFNLAWVAFWIAGMILSAILTPLTAGLFALVALPLIFIASLAGCGIWLFLMYQAHQNKLFRLPIVGKFAAQQAGVNS
jgi:uncharacterized membrane protein